MEESWKAFSPLPIIGCADCKPERFLLIFS